MTTCVRLSIVQNVSVLEVDNPPVNALSRDVVAGLIQRFDEFQTQTETIGLVICACDKTFVAGGDIAEFEKPGFSAQPYNDFLIRLEASQRPVVMALHGTILGGGLELAMAGHHRIAAEGSQFALPEIKLGLIPGSHGTQRLPRLVGLKTAAKMMLTGHMVDAGFALSSNLVDAIVPFESLRDAAISRVQTLVGQAPRRTCDLSVPQADMDALSNVKNQAEKHPFQPAYTALYTSLCATRDLPFNTGIDIEAACFSELVPSPPSRAQRHLFFAERMASRVPAIGKDTPHRIIEKVGVLGIGTMGAGIAVASALAGYEVTISEVDDAALKKGIQNVDGTISAMVKRGRLSDAAGKTCRDRVTGGIGAKALSDCDLVIEAVFEDMDLKCSVVKTLGSLCKKGAIIATNTSTLDVNTIAQASGRPEDVVGTHFFSPAHIMRLLEVIRGNQTAPEVLKSVMHFARRIRKTVVVSGVCYGFIGNRMAETYLRESEALLLEGATPSAIDGIAENPRVWGMAMGPNRMLDMAGIDVGARTVTEWIKSEVGPRDPAYRAMCRAMFTLGSHGQKSGTGYYLYEGRSALPNPKIRELSQKLAEQHRIGLRYDIPNTEIFERLLFPMVNEAARILEEGIANRGSDIDVVWTNGYGFPKWRGGPLFMADELGLQKVVDRMDFYAKRSGNTWGYWDVSPLLRRLANAGGRLSNWHTPH
ncbi:enoyl-CoA hydratase [Sedimentitalea sp. CY04]|uniref:Enoyl-CoA hydratase n=1 Tax=Parasedimentitalea denitrificans TaxID=2211118 RepID=A0ABX0W9K5_9RHOB|nr:3-hydroxyacyl-CoA dehydrogenase NAD-binding domain-containing protein [Sedimentitalea sp. CY04]NIZ62302.1 enoyl-CoA hydratase [Sedimentitalea sp. CY04]